MHDPDPVELVHAEVPMLAQALAVILFIGVCLLWMVIASQQVPV